MAAIRTMSLLGGSVELVIHHAVPSVAEFVFDEVESEGVRLQNIFNFFDPESELSLLNRRREMRVSDELLLVLKRALFFCEDTGGAYDISKGREFLSRKLSSEDVSVSCSFRDIRIDGNTVRLLHPDVLVDLGSIAKGFIADKLLERLRNAGVDSAFIDARGDMAVFGSEREIVDVQHPRIPSSIVSSIVIENSAVATSGDYYQFRGSYDASHIVGKKSAVSATVVAGTLMDADAIATCSLLLDMEKLPSFLKRHYARALIIDDSLHVFRFNRFEEFEMGI